MKNEEFFAKSPLMTTTFSVLILTFFILSSQPTFSITLPFPNPNFPSEAGHSLLGDAHFVDGGNSVQLSLPTPSSSGIIFRTTSFNFTSTTSFSSNFTFEIGNGVALVIIPADFPSNFARNTSFGLLGLNRFLGIEFNVNVCKISSSRVRVSNVSKINHDLKGGVNLSSWIDYHAILKRIDVRLSKLGDPRPVEPLISYRIDLGEMWKGEKVLLGLASSNGNNEKSTNVHSWNSKIKNIPKWLHSNPVNPANPQDRSTVTEDVETSKKRDCFLSGFVFVMGCGVLAALVLFFVWSYAAATPKVPSVLPLDFKYEKIGVVEMKNSETINK